METKSFSYTVKEELCKVKFKEEEALAELCAMLLFGENIENNSIILKTDNAEIAARIQAVFKKSLHEEIPIDIIKGKRNFSIIVDSQTAEKAGVFFSEDGEIAIDEDVYDNDSKKRAFLRGAFMISGTITNPIKGYCCELLTYNENMAYLSVEILENFGINAHIVKRNNYYVSYLKDSNSVSDFLNVIGAHRQMMELMVTQIEKDRNNRNNRESICRAANLDKTIATSAKQYDAILRLQNSHIWDDVDETTKALAAIRLQNFDLSLSAIGEKMEPPMTKSSVNRRLKKLVELAEEL